MSDNPLVVALLNEFKNEALITRPEVGRIIRLTVGQVAGICNRNGIKPWPAVPKEVRKKRSCCFPIGHPGEEGFHLCGKRRESHSFLCEEHRDKAWVPNGKVLPLKK